MKNDNWLVLTEDTMKNVDVMKLKDSIPYVIVPITDKKGKELKEARTLITQLKDIKMPFGITTTFNVTNMDSVGDAARLLYKQSESVGADAKKQWFFIEIDDECVSRMREAVSHYCHLLRDLGVQYLGLRAKKHVMERFMLDTELFNVIDAIEYDSNENNLDRHAFHHPQLHEYTDRGHVDGVEEDVILGHCEDNFSIDQLIQSDRYTNHWFTEKPYEVKVKNSILFYNDADLSDEKGTYPTGEVLQIKDIINKGQNTVFETKEGTYILADRNVLDTVYYEDPQLVGAEIETTRTIHVYNEREFNKMTELDEYREGKHFRIRGLVYDRDGRPRFEINKDEEGHHLFITAKKDASKILGRPILEEDDE